MNKIVFLFVMVSMLSGCFAGQLPTAKVTVCVVDEDGSPITNATATARWYFNKSNDSWTPPGSTQEERSVDSTGKAVFQGKTLSQMGIGAKKNGFYTSGMQYPFKTVNQGNWQPWNSTVTVRLRPIGNVVPLYLGERRILFSEESEVSFDFLKQDYLPPHGKGEVADCIFKLKREQEGERDTVGFYQMETITIEFPEKYNGVELIKTEDFVQESSFKTPRYAYDKTYSPTIIRQSGYRLQENTTSNHPKFLKDRIEKNNTKEEIVFFRIRSETYPDGTFKSGLYGMMKLPDFQLTPSRVPTPTEYVIGRFTYRINMTPNDRNMEVDERWNLRPGSINFYTPEKAKKLAAQQ